MPKLISEAYPAGSAGLQVRENQGEQGDGYDLSVQKLDGSGKPIGKPGKLWVHRDHFAGLQVDDDSIIVNGRLSRSQRAIVCNDVNAPESDYGFAE